MSSAIHRLRIPALCAIVLGFAAGCASRSIGTRDGGTRAPAMPAFAALPIAAAGEDHLENLRQLTTHETARDVVWAADGMTLLFASRRSTSSGERIFALGNLNGAEPVLTSELASNSIRSEFQKRVINRPASAGSTNPFFRLPSLPETAGAEGSLRFSDDGERITYVASRASKDFELRVVRATGRDDRAVTANGATNMAPAFFPGRTDRILFTSNLADPRGDNFDLWAVDSDGTGLERLTYHPAFDGFASLSPDGRRIAFASSRHAERPGERNVFVADWIP